MAAVMEVYSTFKSILDFASEIQRIAEGWHTVSDDYRKQVESLDDELKIYRNLMDDRNLPKDNSIMLILQRAEAKVKKEEQRVKKLEEHINNDKCCIGWGWLIWAKVTMIMFPEKLEVTIKEVMEQIKKIPDILETEDKAVRLIQKHDDNQPIRLNIVDNGLHVPLVETQNEVITAIKSKGPLVVLLHGGVGTGKTILARYVCMYFRQSEPSVFGQVHLEPRCSDSIRDPFTKMLDVLNSLSPTSVRDSLKNAHSGSGSGSGSRIEEALRDFLKTKRVLIILDDVSDGVFLDKMWTAAHGCHGVKYLVTSQMPYLCDNLQKGTWTKIAMGEPTDDEARKILATLVGLDPKVIPSSLEGVAEKVIATTERNPLALACWAGNFEGSANKEDDRAWWGAHADLHNTLSGPVKRVVLGTNELRSLWEAMELCINSFETRDFVKIIFFLIYACPRASVPEGVLNNWYEHFNSSNQTFWSSKGQWCSRGLLVCDGLDTFSEPKDRDEDLQESKAWSLRPVVKLYMKYLIASKNQALRNEIVYAMANFLGDEDLLKKYSVHPQPVAAMKIVTSEKEKVAIALCALYFDPVHEVQIVTDLAARAISASNMKAVEPEVINRRKRAVEPIIWLLGQPQRTNWTEQGLSSARKVFLAYVCEYQLDWDQSSALLLLHSYPPAQQATLTALNSMFNIDEALVPEGEKARHMLEVLLVLLDSKARHCNIRLAEASIRLLEAILDSFCKSLSKPDNPPLQVQAALALDSIFKIEKAMVSSQDACCILQALLALLDSKARLLETRFIEATSVRLLEAILDILCKSLSKLDNPDLQVQTALALGSIFETEEMPVPCENSRRVLEALLNILLDSKARRSTGVYEASFKALESMLGNLSKSLSSPETPDLQAALALTVLAFGDKDSIGRKVLDEDRAVADVVKSLSRHEKGDLTEQVTRAFRNITLRSDEATDQKIANEKGVLAGLVKALSNDEQSGSQPVDAFFTLCFLSKGNDKSSTAAAIANEEGALAGLLKFLSKDEDPALQRTAAKALANFAQWDAARRRMANETGLVQGLVKCLSTSSKSQDEAARALFNMSCTGDYSGKVQIINEHGALTDLVKCLSADNNSNTRCFAAGALADLAFTYIEGGDGSSYLPIPNEAGALGGLALCLCEHGMPQLREVAARAFRNMAFANDVSIKEKIVNEDWALTGLRDGLYEWEWPALQEHAAIAVWHLATTNNRSLKERIRNEDGLLAGLVSMSKQDNLSLQNYANGALNALGEINCLSEGKAVEKDSPQLT